MPPFRDSVEEFKNIENGLKINYTSKFKNLIEDKEDLNEKDAAILKKEFTILIENLLQEEKNNFYLRIYHYNRLQEIYEKEFQEIISNFKNSYPFNKLEFDHIIVQKYSEIMNQKRDLNLVISELYLSNLKNEYSLKFQEFYENMNLDIEKIKSFSKKYQLELEKFLESLHAKNDGINPYLERNELSDVFKYIFFDIYNECRSSFRMKYKENEQNLMKQVKDICDEIIQKNQRIEELVSDCRKLFILHYDNLFHSELRSKLLWITSDDTHKKASMIFREAFESSTLGREALDIDSLLSYRFECVKIFFEKRNLVLMNRIAYKALPITLGIRSMVPFAIAGGTVALPALLASRIVAALFASSAAAIGVSTFGFSFLTQKLLRRENRTQRNEFKNELEENLSNNTAIKAIFQLYMLTVGIKLKFRTHSV